MLDLTLALSFCVASMLLKEEPKNPKCFAETKKDFACFWEEDEERAGSVDQYSFTYAYQ